jgi:hypothetical protein
MKTAEKVCSICGQPHWAEDGWFLLAESRWQDRVRILDWNDKLANQPGVHCACSAPHVEQLVVHWMTTGSLGHPFARPESEATFRPRRPRRKQVQAGTDTTGGRLIGELAVDRESMLRVLRESPHSLTSILEALVRAHRRDLEGVNDPGDWEEMQLPATEREM